MNIINHTTKQIFNWFQIYVISSNNVIIQNNHIYSIIKTEKCLGKWYKNLFQAVYDNIYLVLISLLKLIYVQLI